VLITGAARGMGASHAAAFAAEGALVVATDVLDDLGRAMAAVYGQSVRYRHLDVTSAADWRAVVEETEREFGPIDVLVNNAGISRPGSLFDQSEADFRATMDINVGGAFLGMKAVVPGMVARGRGAVVNVSSMVAMIGLGGNIAYGTSKWAVRGLTKMAALDVARSGVRINSVHPGAVRTPMAGDLPASAVAGQPIPRIGEPEEISRVVLFLASDEASFVTGAEYVVDGGHITGEETPFDE
jgi:3alpha(or 20beta)-hydroxysteroid dehydrogenase